MHESATRLYDAAAQFDPEIQQPSQLARAMALPAQMITNWGTRGVSKDGALLAEKLFGVSPTWVLEGVSIQKMTPRGAAKSGIVRFARYDVRPSAGQGGIVDTPPSIIDTIEVLESWAFEKLGTNNPNKVKIVTNKGVSMAPTIKDGDILFVDVTQTFYDGDGIYVIDWNGRLLTKRLIAKMDGRIAISSDNQSPEYETEYVTQKNQDALAICGRVKAYFSLREIL